MQAASAAQVGSSSLLQALNPKSGLQRCHGACMGLRCLAPSAAHLGGLGGQDWRGCFQLADAQVRRCRLASLSFREACKPPASHLTRWPCCRQAMRRVQQWDGWSCGPQRERCGEEPCTPGLRRCKQAREKQSQWSLPAQPDWAGAGAAGDRCGAGCSALAVPVGTPSWVRLGSLAASDSGWPGLDSVGCGPPDSSYVSTCRGFCGR